LPTSFDDDVMDLEDIAPEGREDYTCIALAV